MMRRRGARTPALIAALAALAALAACHKDRAAGGAGPAGTDEPVTVRTAPAGSSGAGWTEVPGTIEAIRRSSLAGRLPAAVARVAVEEGARVRKGDLLVRLDARDIMARVEAARAALRAARSQRDRVRALLAKEAATRQELEIAEAQDAAAEAALRAEEAQLDYVEIRAPFDGWIVEKKASEGDLVLPGQTLVTIHETGAMRVAATVPEEQARRLRRGQQVGVVMEDGRVAVARVSILGPASDPTSRRFLLKADLPAGDAARAGSFARLRIPGGGQRGLAMAPKSALIERGALTGLLVVENGEARLRWISPGDETADSVTVRSGLKPGEELVLHPSGLVDGARVTPIREGTR